jgi:uncharacterized membrane protein
VVGQGYFGAFSWTVTTGVVPLGFSRAVALTADGSVIVGDFTHIWDVVHGTRNLKTVLENDYGIDLAGWDCCHPRGISRDGKVIVGIARDPQGNFVGWIANLPVSPAETSP